MTSSVMKASPNVSSNSCAAAAVHAAQHVALDQDAAKTCDDGRRDQAPPEAETARAGVPDIGAEHVEPRVREVQDAHHAEDERQASSYHEQE
jgi:hypothetical protein